MKDYELKKIIISDKLDKLYRNTKRDIYNTCKEPFYEDMTGCMTEVLDIDKYNQELEKLECSFSPDCLRVIKNLNHNRQRNRKLLSFRILSMLKCNCLNPCFITLTFRDEILQNTSFETRRKYVRRFLKSCCYDYVANVDYGKKNEREHYHATCLLISDDALNVWQEKYGFFNLQKIWLFNQNDDKTSEKLSKYMLKLAFHALKESNKTNKAIYMRDVSFSKLQELNYKKQIERVMKSDEIQ